MHDCFKRKAIENFTARQGPPQWNPRPPPQFLDAPEEKRVHGLGVSAAVGMDLCLGPGLIHAVGGVGCFLSRRLDVRFLTETGVRDKGVRENDKKHGKGGVENHLRQFRRNGYRFASLDCDQVILRHFGLNAQVADSSIDSGPGRRGVVRGRRSVRKNHGGKKDGNEKVTGTNHPNHYSPNTPGRN